MTASSEYFREVILQEYEPDNKSINRPNWHEYFLLLAKDISLRSDDPNIKHGAVITTLENRIIGTGFNGTISGTTINDIDYFNRDEKRNWMIHAESNSINFCLINPRNISGAKIYVTGKPCFGCTKQIISFGITEIHYANQLGSITHTTDDDLRIQKLLDISKVRYISYPVDTFWLKKNYL